MFETMNTIKDNKLHTHQIPHDLPSGHVFLFCWLLMSHL